MTLSHTVVIVLAGGKGTRIAGKADGLPKCLLPVGTSQNLLGRALEQLSAAADWQVVVCCSEENHSVLSASQRNSVANAVSYQVCRACPLGPLRALEEVVRSRKAPRYLLWLADLYFYGNPVPAIRCLSDRMAANGYVVVGDNVARRDGTGSGYVVANGEHISEICYRSPEQDSTGTMVYRWSGLFLFDHFLALDLLRHSDDYTHAALETWLNDARGRGFALAPFVSEPFVNVNTESDYAFVDDETMAQREN